MAGGIEARAIFISYRRDDSEGEAGRLYDDLVRAYSDDSVFMDVAGIQPGVDFRKAIDTNVGSCGVLLAIIGPTWATIADSAGNRRLENPDDYVRLEIASALKRNIPVIPVLVHDAHMPALEMLPDDLKDLRYRNSVELTHARWNSDVTLLIGALKSYVTVDTKRQAETVHATIPVQLPAPQASPPAAPAKKSNLLLMVGIGIVVVAAIIGGVFAVRHNQSPAQPLQQTDSSNPASSNPAQPSSTPQPAAGASSAPQASLSPAEAAFLGKWKITQEPDGGDTLDKLSVLEYRGGLMVQAWGKCAAKKNCDWGSQRASLKGADLVTDAYHLRNIPSEITNERSATLTLTLTGDGLQTVVKNRHTADGQTKEDFHQAQFVKEQ